MAVGAELAEMMRSGCFKEEFQEIKTEKTWWYMGYDVKFHLDVYTVVHNSQWVNQAINQ